ncbi:DUF4435 domain-containing protein [Mucilaginibacter dorajii]|uniref:DUF4435 domain-containing protein n=1 Tax=Mucilaginibacter dorajii TaxID=692994 RepID=A0ABP7PMC8_9SPHI|nr:DUF4435 domain-containing protein [Mucilaginibacter dorajii]MCS3733717.1 hypothetical protein [Mucilaginibacter dorajii]
MIESLIDNMIAAIDDPVVAFTDFILAHKKKPDAVFCFFEGIDDLRYYKPRIFKIIPPNNFREFNCGGKDKVKEAYALIKGNEVYSLCRTGFFIDKDYEKAFNNKDFYETNCYSIENFYLSNSCIEEILIDCFKIQRESPDLIRCLTLFSELLEEFHKRTLPLNAWLACYSDLRVSGKVNRRLKIDSTINRSLDNTVLGDMSGINEIRNINTHDEIERLFSCQGVCHRFYFLRKIIYFKNISQRDFFRGKFQLKFLESFFKKLQIKIGSLNNDLLSKDYPSSIIFEYSNLTILFNSHAATPDELMEYIFMIKE